MLKNKYIYIYYSQISVFRSEFKNPFNDWQEEHVNQGFSWRPGSVSFKTLDEEGEITLYYSKKTSFEIDINTIRGIRVPFEITGEGLVEISSITESIPLKFQPGSYNLFYESGIKPSPWIKFTFILNEQVKADVFKCDKGLNPQEPFLMSANEA